MELKVFVVGTATHYPKWIKNHVLTENIEEADIVFFTGGEDVHPDMYGQPMNRKTYANIDRDIREKEYWDKAVELGKFIIGVCRGSQFSCAMSGGLLVQHADSHGLYGGHNITTDDGRVYHITSTHHQMMFPYNLPAKDYQLIAWSTEERSHVHESVEWKEDYLEPEIVYFKKTKALGIQGHPEMMNMRENTIEYLNELVIKLMK